jgi:hypothetical protein
LLSGGLLMLALLFNYLDKNPGWVAEGEAWLSF